MRRTGSQDEENGARGNHETGFHSKEGKKELLF
jgi:hypothetical protein